MGLIKSDNPRATTTQPFSLGDVEAHARAILAKAVARSEQLLTQARQTVLDAQQEARALKADAMEAGRTEGLAEGLQLGEQKGFEAGQLAGQQQAFEQSQAAVAELQQTLAAAIAAVEQHRLTLEQSAETNLIRLAVAIADRIARRAGITDPSVLKHNVTDAVRLTLDKSDLRLLAHPSQRELLATMLPDLQSAWPQIDRVEIVDDESIAPGGVKITTRGGEIDADLASQLDRIATELLGGGA